MPVEQSLTDLKRLVMYRMVDDIQLVKALVIDNESFLDAEPTSEQNVILQSPKKLIRTQIMPHKNVLLNTNKDKPYITSSWVGFKKISNVYKNGTVYFYIILPNTLEYTDYGIRYDFIADRLESILGNRNNVGEFEFVERGDIPIDSENLGHYISFKILDFYDGV